MHTAEKHSTSAVQQASPPSQHTANDTLAATLPPALLSACPSPVDCSGFQGLFDCILRSLQEASWPSHSRRSDVISAMSPGSGYFNFGVQLSRKSCLTQVTRELPHVCRDLNALFRFLFPAARWNTICVSRDCLSLLHADTANVPGSPTLSLSLGSFTGGRLWLEDLHCLRLGAPTSVPSGDSWLHGVAVDTHCCPISFDGRIRHMTLPYQGERWALTAVTLPGVCCRDLEFWDFRCPLPRFSLVRLCPLRVLVLLRLGLSPSDLWPRSPCKLYLLPALQLSALTLHKLTSPRHLYCCRVPSCGVNVLHQATLFRIRCKFSGLCLPHPIHGAQILLQNHLRVDSLLRFPLGLRNPFAPPSATRAEIRCSSILQSTPLLTSWNLIFSSRCCSSAALAPSHTWRPQLAPCIPVPSGLRTL